MHTCVNVYICVCVYIQISDCTEGAFVRLSQRGDSHDSIPYIYLSICQ